MNQRRICSFLLYYRDHLNLSKHSGTQGFEMEWRMIVESLRPQLGILEQEAPLYARAGYAIEGIVRTLL